MCRAAQRVEERGVSVVDHGAVFRFARVVIGDGYGRELAGEGIREFVNVRTFWVGATR